MVVSGVIVTNFPRRHYVNINVSFGHPNNRDYTPHNVLVQVDEGADFCTLNFQN